MKRIALLLLFALGVSNALSAQDFTLSADIRPRFEYRHGFGAPFPDNAKPAAFVTQRSRLNMNFGMDRLSVYFSMQDVSTWGDTRQLAISDDNHSFSLFQAWLRYGLSDHWFVKVGRQAISYDDQRILGEVDWTMQGRFHDAAVIQYSKEGLDLDLAFAFNQENQSNLGSDYTITGMYSYKVMQLAYVTKKWEKSTFSFIFMNNGFQKYTGETEPTPDGVYYRQTTGANFSFPVSPIQLTGSVYYQSGKANATTDLSALQWMGEAIYRLGKAAFTVGFESLSGTDQSGSEQNNSFFPLYGTNHKFNGLMDYFYVGNHANSVGLNDIYGKVQVKASEKSSLGAHFHHFSAQASLANGMDKNLGSEVDLVYSWAVSPVVKLNAGYSQLFATESMAAIKGGAYENTNNWGWVMLVVNPTLLTLSKGESTH